MSVFWKEKYWLSRSLPPLVHEINLTPSGKRQGCHGVKTIQRRVKDAAMIPLPAILIACLCLLVFFKHLPQGWHDENVVFTLSTNISKYILGLKKRNNKRNPWHSCHWKVRNVLKSASSFNSLCTVWIPVGRADEKHGENWQEIYKPNTMQDICAYCITWDNLGMAGCPLYYCSSSLLQPLF